MKKSLIPTAASLSMILMLSCETDCPPCGKCELEYLGVNSEWGEKF